MQVLVLDFLVKYKGLCFVSLATLTKSHLSLARDGSFCCQPLLRLVNEIKAFLSQDVSLGFLTESRKTKLKQLVWLDLADTNNSINQ